MLHSSITASSEGIYAYGAYVRSGNQEMLAQADTFPLSRNKSWISSMQLNSSVAVSK
jgi:hypothetical protein